MSNNEDDAKNKEEAIETKTNEVTINSFKIHANSVTQVMDYVIRNTGLGKKEISDCKDVCDRILDELSVDGKYFGELVLSICFCYQACLKSMLSIIEDKSNKKESFTLEEIAIKVFENMGMGSKDIQ